MNIPETCSLLMSHPKLKAMMFDVLKQKSVLCQAVMLSHIPNKEAAQFLHQLGEERRYMVCKKIALLCEVPRSEMNQEVQAVVDEINILVNHGVKKEYYTKTIAPAKDVIRALYDELPPGIRNEIKHTVKGSLL